MSTEEGVTQSMFFFLWRKVIQRNRTVRHTKRFLEYSFQAHQETLGNRSVVIRIAKERKWQKVSAKNTKNTEATHEIKIELKKRRIFPSDPPCITEKELQATGLMVGDWFRKAVREKGMWHCRWKIHIFKLIEEIRDGLDKRFNENGHDKGSKTNKENAAELKQITLKM